MGAWEDAWQRFEAEAGPVLSSALSDAAPYSTGELAASMTWEDQQGRLTAGSSDARGPIAAYVTRGTAPHGIDPVYASVLHFFAGDGTEVFASHVDHPGTAANPFHIDAWGAARDGVLAAFRREMPGAALSYLNPWRNRTLEV